MAGQRSGRDYSDGNVTSLRRNSRWETTRLIEQLQRENRLLREEIRRLAVYEELANSDALTGLFSRRYFEDRLHQELSRSSRSQSPLSVIVIDMDGFKNVNDTAGHLAGDAVLKWMGSFLKEHARHADIPCRIGGDEFALILPDTDRAGVQRLISRLDAALAQAEDLPSLPEGAEIAFSMGAATFPDEAPSADDLVACADTRMYTAKRARHPARSLPALFCAA